MACWCANKVLVSVMRGKNKHAEKAAPGWARSSSQEARPRKEDELLL